MKYWLSHLPLELWVEVFVFPWISRRQLAKIVDKFRNRKFADYLQFFLHEWGKQTLGALHLDKAFLLNIPRTPLPENIKFFKQLTICHFDFRTIDFLRRISTLFISNDVNLSFFCWFDMAKYRTVLNHLAPMLRGIHSLEFDQDAIPLVEQYFAQKLAKVKMLFLGVFDPTEYQAIIDFCLNWLTSTGERDPTEPRFLKVCTNTEAIQLFYEAIRQQFLSAKSPCTFAIELYGGYDTPNKFQMENSIGEQLHHRQPNLVTYRIFRHQPNAGTALQEWIKATVEKSGKSSVIRIDASTGTIAVVAVGVPIMCVIIGVIIMIFISIDRYFAH